MGGGSSRQAFRQAVLDLISTKEAVAGQGNTFWERYWSDPSLTAQDYFALLTTEDVQNLKKDASGNLTALCFKVVERISVATTTACTGPNDHIAVLNCVRLLTRLIPFLFEDSDWRLLFWSPANFSATQEGEQPQALAQVLLNSLADLLFCPDFTVVPKTKQGPENPDDLSSIDSCEHIWEAGIGCSVSPGRTDAIDSHRTEIIKLLVTCFSETLYYKPEEIGAPNRWMLHFTSSENRHVLPILTSLLNVTCTYDPVGYGVPYYWTMVGDPRGDLVEAAVQLLCLVLDYYPHSQVNRLQAASQPQAQQPEPGAGNLFCGYVSRLHQNEDLEFVAKGMINLIYNPVRHTYLPYSIKKVFFTQELYIVLWKMCELNKRFMIHLLRSPVLFDLVVPILINILESRANPAMVGMLHVGVFIFLLLSGERNFGVRLNKPFVPRITIPDIPKFTGTHADLLFLVFHKVITSGLPRLQPLYDSLLTILVNVSPYLKSLSMVTCSRLMHLLESFSTTWFLFAKPTNHFLVFYLLEIFNNIVQYQFDGNTNLIYSLLRTKEVFYQLSNLPEDSYQLVAPTRPVDNPLADTNQLEGDSKAGSEGTSKNTDGQVVSQIEPTPAVQQSTEGGHVPMPEIEPAGRVHMVEVEVEHNRDGLDTPTSPLQPDDTPTSPVSPSEQDQTILNATPPQVTPTRTPPPQATPVAATGSPASQREGLPAGAQTYVSAYDARPSKGKGKPLKSPLTRNLMPLNRDVARSTQSLVEPVATPNFKPTPEWVRSWKQKLPLHTVIRVLQVLVPQVEKLCAENDVKTDQEILEYLKNGTLVGLLPVPHPILIRKYQTSENTEKWFHSYIWGVLYVRNYDPPIWYDTSIRLFQVAKPSVG